MIVPPGILLLGKPADGAPWLKRRRQQLSRGPDAERTITADEASLSVIARSNATKQSTLPFD
jgi:hypothetical protein